VVRWQTKVVNIKQDQYDVYIGRPGKWGNPYTHLVHAKGKHVASREEAIEKYRTYIERILEQNPRFLEPLKGKTLGCFCKPLACHGDVIVEILNEQRTTTIAF
jgi:hypothetical protein